eukprot:TRINITY_DN59229_c0_g1_i1.p1 TRINITY_DN59229_c0_g1~~TRINITY_DN59229_c0_g1_i1.p1  ORF type:complete len:518 (+),score=88.68 TRINITY_DN59229_c0_g1_i1:28-1581(+)
MLGRSGAAASAGPWRLCLRGSHAGQPGRAVALRPPSLAAPALSVRQHKAEERQQSPRPAASRRGRGAARGEALSLGAEAASAAILIGSCLRGCGHQRRLRTGAAAAVAAGGDASIPPEELEVLRRAVARLIADPSQLQRKDLAFLRAWAGSLGQSGSSDQAACSPFFGSAAAAPSRPPTSLAQRAAAAAAAAHSKLQGPEWRAAWPPATPGADRAAAPNRAQQPPREVARPATAAEQPGVGPVPIFYPPEMRGPSRGAELPDGLKVYIATPAYGGQVTVDYMTSVIHMVTQLKEVAWQLQLVAGASIITVGRNNAVMEFLQTDCTHLLFLDADVAFTVDTIHGLLAADKDVALAPYPAKNMNEERMQATAAQRGHPRLADGLHYVLHAQADKVQEALNRGQRLVEVDAGPTGCMLIKRGVFHRLQQAYPNLHCRICGSHAGRTKRWDVWWRFFDTMVQDGEFLGEDIAFCRLWRDIGGTIWADLGATMTHVGRFAYTGNMLESSPLRDLVPAPGSSR